MKGKHFRADVFDLALLVVANLISDKLPVERAISLAEGCAKRVACHALCQKEAWTGSEQAVQYPQFFEHQAARAVSERFTRYGPVIPARYFVLWAEGSEYWDYETNHAFEIAAADQLRGAKIVQPSQIK